VGFVFASMSSSSSTHYIIVYGTNARAVHWRIAKVAVRDHFALSLSPLKLTISVKPMDTTFSTPMPRLSAVSSTRMDSCLCSEPTLRSSSSVAVRMTPPHLSRRMW
jgi:hypothetical protein